MKNDVKLSCRKVSFSKDNLIFLQITKSLKVEMADTCSYNPHKQLVTEADVLQNRGSQKFRKIHWKTPAVESIF